MIPDTHADRERETENVQLQLATEFNLLLICYVSCIYTLVVFLILLQTKVEEGRGGIEVV